MLPLVKMNVVMIWPDSACSVVLLFNKIAQKLQGKTSLDRNLKSYFTGLGYLWRREQYRYISTPLSEMVARSYSRRLSELYLYSYLSGPGQVDESRPSFEFSWNLSISISVKSYLKLCVKLLNRLLRYDYKQLNTLRGSIFVYLQFD
jgi:hypothetical protein